MRLDQADKAGKEALSPKVCQALVGDMQEPGDGMAAGISKVQPDMRWYILTQVLIIQRKHRDGIPTLPALALQAMKQGRNIRMRPSRELFGDPVLPLRMGQAATRRDQPLHCTPGHRSHRDP